MSEINWNELKDKAHSNAVKHGFWEGRPSDKHFLCLVISELMEAVEADRKGRYHYTKKFDNPKIEIEEWKPITGYEEDYEVSNLGRVRSKDILVWGGKSYYQKKGKVLKPGLGGAGYYTVSLRGKTHKVACLVANAFLIKESDSDYVNHIDGDKTNDNVSNLEYVSPSSNSKHASITGLHIYKGKLSYEQKVEIAFLHKRGLAYTTIHKNNDYGVSKSAIQRICNEYEKYTESVEFELADAAIRLLDLAGANNLNLNRFCLQHVVTPKKSFTENIYAIVKDLVNYKYSQEEQINYALHQIRRLSEILKINLSWHIQQKMYYNESREKMHGKSY